MAIPPLVENDAFLREAIQGDEADDVSADSDRSTRLFEYFICVGIGDELVPLQLPEVRSRPITRIEMRTGSIPEDVECIRATPLGRSANFGGRYFGGEAFLCIYRGSGPPITAIDFISGPACPQGYNMVNYNISGRMVGKAVNICYATEENKLPIMDILVISERHNEVTPPDYWIMQAPSSGIVSGLNICFKKGPATPLDVPYRPVVMDRYPRKDCPFNPLPAAVASVCQPVGSILVRRPLLPTCHDFVLTSGEGIRIFGSAVTFYEPVPEHVWERSLSTILKTYPRSCKDSPNGKDTLSVPVGARPALPPRIVSTDCQSPQHSTRTLSFDFSTQPLYASKTICLLSHYPYLNNFKDMLTCLYRISVSPSQLPIERFLSNMWEIPIPMTSRVCSQFSIGSNSMIFSSPYIDEELPEPNWAFEVIFRCLPLDAIIQTFTALLLERKVVLFSSHARLLTPVAQTLLALLFPLEWQYSYIPVLPLTISSILDAPMPVFVGIQQNHIDSSIFQRDDVVVVNLDFGQCFVPPSRRLPALPPACVDKLKHHLKVVAHLDSLPALTVAEMQDIDLAFHNVPSPVSGSLEAARIRFDACACRGAFLHLFVSLIGDFREQLLYPSQGSTQNLPDMFDVQTFLDSKPRAQKKFLSEMVQTMCFTRFVEERTFTCVRETELKFFDRCCAYHKSVEATSVKASGLGSLPSLVQSFTRRESRKETYVVHPLLALQQSQTQENVMFRYDEFPVLNPSLMSPIRPIDVRRMVNFQGKKSEITSLFEDAFVTGNTRLRRASTIEHVSQSSFPTSEAWAKHLLKQVYGAWFAILASMTPGTGSSDIVDDAFAALNRCRLRTAPSAAEYLASSVPSDKVGPDENMFRHVLVLCGKFERPGMAHSVLALMKEGGIIPSQQTFAAFTSAVTEAPVSPKSRGITRRPFHDSQSNLVGQDAEVPDWSSVQMCSKFTCPGCGAELSDGEVMAGWTDNAHVYTSDCVVCRTAAFVPQLEIRLMVRNLSIEGTSRERRKFVCPYLSPLVLRKEAESAAAKFPEDLSSSFVFCSQHQTLFWNMMWYCYHEHLGLQVLVKDGEIASVSVKPITRRRKDSSFVARERAIDAQPDLTERYGKQNTSILSALIRYLKRKDLLNAMRLFLLHRIREANVKGDGVLDTSTSIWARSMFREFDALGGQWFYESRSAWLKAFREAQAHVPGHMASYMLPMDKAPSASAQIFEDIFRHNMLHEDASQSDVLSSPPLTPGTYPYSNTASSANPTSFRGIKNGSLPVSKVAESCEPTDADDSESKAFQNEALSDEDSPHNSPSGSLAPRSRMHWEVLKDENASELSGFEDSGVEDGPNLDNNIVQLANEGGADVPIEHHLPFEQSINQTGARLNVDSVDSIQTGPIETEMETDCRSIKYLADNPDDIVDLP